MTVMEDEEITEETLNQMITIPEIEWIQMKRRSDRWLEVVDIEARGLFSTRDLELIDKYYKKRLSKVKPYRNK